MSKYVWRQIHVWVGVESTRWTKATTKAWFPKTSFDFGDKIETIEDEASLGLKLDVSDIDVSKHYGQWSMEGKVQANSIGYFLLAMLGQKVTTTVTAGKVFEHIFTINNTGSNPSLTIFTKEGNGDYNYPLALIENLTLNATVWNHITVNVSFKSKKGKTDNLTATYETDYPFKAKHSEFRIADDEAWLVTAPVACIESFELQITKENIEDFCLNAGNEPIDILDGKIGITWSITAVFADEGYRNIALNGTQKAFQFSLEDDTTDIANTAWKTPLLEFTLPKVKFTDYGRDTSNDSLVKQNLSFKVFQNDSSTEAIKVKLRNGKSNY